MLFVKIGINKSQAISSKKLMKFTVLYTATMKRSKQLLRKFKANHQFILVKQGERTYLVLHLSPPD